MGRNSGKWAKMMQKGVFLAGFGVKNAKVCDGRKVQMFAGGLVGTSFLTQCTESGIDIFSKGIRN
jgi:hypothetical protein